MTAISGRFHPGRPRPLDTHREQASNEHRVAGRCGAVQRYGQHCDIGICKAASVYAAIDSGHGQRSLAPSTCSSDAAALIETYKAHDFEGVLSRLTGAFSIALVDEREERVLIAIDRMGIKPLCYSTNSDGFHFGSTTDLVIDESATSTKFCAQSLFDYVYFHIIPSPNTVFDGISKLEPGQYVIYENGELNSGFYWTPVFTAKKTADANELAVELFTHLHDAIDRATPDGHTGAFLSGGLDSSTVCGLANERTETPLPVYTIGFDQDGYDEMEFAKAAADHFNLELRPYYATPQDVAEALPLIASNYDEPFGNSSAVPAYLCGKLAKQDGLSHLLAGDGGDELFAGNERYVKQTIFEHYQTVPLWLRRSLLEPVASAIHMKPGRFFHKVKRYIEQAQVAMPERLQTYNFLHIHPPQFVFTDSFLKCIEPRHPIDMMESWYQRSNSNHLINRMLQLDWKLTLADNDLRKVNVMCDASGVAVSYPLLDDALVEFSTRIPVGLKIRRNELRSFYKRAVKHYLPAKIIEKEKHGFGLPFGEWIRTNHGLDETVNPALENLVERNIIRSEFIEFLLDGNRTTHAAFFGNLIWVLASLEFWLSARSEGLSTF